MGGFYGSVQIKTTDQGPVRLALEEFVRSGRRFLLGPALNGWVGVYPDGGGQDFGVARDLAGRLGGELIAMLVHDDDDVFAYEYYRDGECADRYDSIPDYHHDVTDEERRQLAGQPERFAHLAADRERFAALSKRLAYQDEAREVFSSALLEEFAATLGIRNAVTSYEYLKDNEETEGIEGWRRFVHVPDLSGEKARAKAAKAAIAREKKLLARQGKLLAERGGIKGWAAPSPWWCPAPDGRSFLVAWSSHADPREQNLPLELHGLPWADGPRATPWAIGPHVYGMELSPSGRYLAVAHAAGDWKASLWDLAENRPVAEVPQVRAVSSVGFLAGESAMFSVSSSGDEGRVEITPIGPGEPRTFEIAGATLGAAHPKEPWIVVADNKNRLLLVDIDLAQVVRMMYVGRRYAPSALEQQLVASFQAWLEAAERGELDEQGRKLLESQLEKSGTNEGSVAGSSPQIEEMLVRMRQTFMEKAAALTNRGIEQPFRLRFDHEGEWLFVATSVGPRVYSWRQILGADEPKATFSVDLATDAVKDGASETRFEGYVYDLSHDTQRNRLLFAGVEGRVRYLDLDTGESGVLLDPPGRSPILRLALSRDHSVLALTCSPDMQGRAANRRGPVVQFWNYNAITGGVGAPPDLGVGTDRWPG